MTTQSNCIALIGGSFNPPHADHGRILKWLSEDSPFNLKEIWVLPVVEHPLGKELLPYEQREKFIQALIESVSRRVQRGFFMRMAENVKIVRREERYTVDMLTALREENPDDEFILVVGGDIINESEKWERWDEVNKLARVVVVAREGVEVPDTYETYPIESRGFSSTAIRDQLAKGDLTHLNGFGGMLTDHALRIIRRKGHYGYADPTFPDQSIKLDHVDIPMSVITKYGPCKLFCLNGIIRRVVRVESAPLAHGVEPGVRFMVIRDTAMHAETFREKLRWQENETEAWAKGLVSLAPEPKPKSSGIFYLQPGEDFPGEGWSNAQHLGTIDKMEFFSTESTGIFGGLFGLF